MGYYVEVTARAKEDLEEMTRWIAQYSGERAFDWLAGCQEAVESLSDFPWRCPLAHECREGERQIRHLLFDQHRILFEIEDETVTVLHIRHQRRQPFEPDEM